MYTVRSEDSTHVTAEAKAVRAKSLTDIERLVQKKQACSILGISRATLDRWRVRYENFPQSQNPNPKGRCLFRLSDLMNWIAHRAERVIS